MKKNYIVRCPSLLAEPSPTLPDMTDHTPPFEARADANAAADRSAMPEGGPVTVLQVEPDERSAELLEAFAGRLTDRVRVRSVGRFGEALDALRAGVTLDGERVAVDCVVTEQRLPNGSGVDLAERLTEGDEDFPVVFHTTCPAEESEAAAFGAGADAYFEKGSDRGRYDAILDRICALVDERRAGEAAATVDVASTPNALGPPGRTLRSEE